MGAWSAPELDYLRRAFGLRPSAAIARRLRRSETSVRARARLVFGGRRRREPWQPADDQALRAGFGAVPDADLALALRRSLQDLRARAAQLRAQRTARPWRAADEAKRRRLNGHRGATALEVCLSRSARDIEAAAARLCLRKDRKFLARACGKTTMPRWSEPDVALLRTLYPTTDNLAIARAMRRSVVSVANKANQLGLKKRKRWLRLQGRASAARRWGS
jgi:hypothetical protein